MGRLPYLADNGFALASSKEVTCSGYVEEGVCNFVCCGEVAELKRHNGVSRHSVAFIRL